MPKRSVTMGRNTQQHCRTPATLLQRKVPKLCLQVLREARAATPHHGTRLLDIWPSDIDTPGQTFRDWLRDDEALWRLTPGMLQSAAEAESYLAGGDWLLSRLQYAPANAALPAAASYSAYSAEELVAAVAHWFVDPPASNAAGSLLDSGDEFYRVGFHRLQLAIEAATGQDAIEHHNLTTLYIDAALRAGTGARPADDTWQWSRVNLATGLTFVDDKTGLDASAARWVLVPGPLCRLVQQHYLDRHVPALQARVSGRFGLSGAEAAKMLDRSLCWLTETADGVVAETLQSKHRLAHRNLAVDHPLPLNALRHRARTTWRRLGMDP